MHWSSKSAYLMYNNGTYHHKLCLSCFDNHAAYSGCLANVIVTGTPCAACCGVAEHLGDVLQTYRSPGSFLQLWFEAAAHQELQGQCEPWGGLWTADSADAFVQDAVRMYRAEEDWHTWQQRGFELLQNLYNKEARLHIVKVMFG